MLSDMKSHYKELEVWKQSIDLADAIYALTRHFPKEELYGLTSQIRRSAVSVPSNIAEGAARHSQKEFHRFLSMAAGSLAECNTQLILAERAHYLSPEELHQLTESLDRVGKMLNALRNRVKETIHESSY